MKPAAPPSTSSKQRGKRRRKSQGVDDQDTDNTHIQNRQRVDLEADSILPQTRRSGRSIRLTESARAMQ
jgi:hypothetical protein